MENENPLKDTTCGGRQSPERSQLFYNINSHHLVGSLLLFLPRYQHAPFQREKKDMFT